MKNSDSWKYVFPALAVLFWAATAFVSVSSQHPYTSDDAIAMIQVLNATRWQPALLVGAIICTAASYVLLKARKGG